MTQPTTARHPQPEPIERGTLSPQTSSSQRGPGGKSPQSESPVALPGPSVSNGYADADPDKPPGYIPSSPYTNSQHSASGLRSYLVNRQPSEGGFNSPGSYQSRRSYMSYTSNSANSPGPTTVMDMTRPSFTNHASLSDLLRRVASTPDPNCGSEEGELIESEVANSPELFCLGKNARDQLKSAAAIKEKIRQLEQAIKMLDAALPKITHMLNILPNANMDAVLIDKVFMNMNISRTGYITYPEFRHCLRNLGVTDDVRLSAAFHNMDHNRDDLLDKNEFRRNIQEIVALQHRQVCMTNVIQDLLRRVQQNNLSSRLRTDFSAHTPIRLERILSLAEIAFLTEQMAWIRGNVLATNMSDATDAKMTVLGAQDIQRSLHHILKKLDDRRIAASQPGNNSALT